VSFIDKAKEALADTMAKAKDLLDADLDRIEETIAEAGIGNGHREIRTHLTVRFDTGRWPASGVLSVMGYRVGNNGLPDDERRLILREVFEVELVSGSPDSDDYVREWGEPRSPQRLGKMNRALWGFIKLAQRRTSADMSGALADWGDDLDWVSMHLHPAG